MNRTNTSFLTNAFRTVLATLRMVAIIPMLAVTTLLILLLAPFPIRIRGGVRLSIYPVIWYAHFFMWVLNIRYTCTDPEKLRTHSGLIVFNHLSYMDVMSIMRIVPARFMATIGVKKIPLIGWATSAVDTIFVNRGNKESRAQARIELGKQLQAQPFPPLGIFPEGKIGDNTSLQPFRHGAFDVAISQGVDCLACAIHYEPYPLISWTDKEETLPQAIWRLAVAEQRLHITLLPLDVLHHGEYENAASMAEAAYALVDTALYKS